MPGTDPERNRPSPTLDRSSGMLTHSRHSRARPIGPFDRRFRSQAQRLFWIGQTLEHGALVVLPSEEDGEHAHQAQVIIHIKVENRPLLRD